MIAVKDLQKSYRGQKVIDGVTFKIATGSVTTIIGSSGAGKSVLLRQLMGLEQPDEGEISFDGVNIVGMGEAQLNRIRRRFGILFQNGALFDWLSVGENVAFPLRERTKMKEAEIRDTVRDLLNRVGLSGHEDKFPDEISGGMRKRVALARALAMDPDVVFFDEPTAGLDPITKNTIYRLIQKTHEEATITYLIVSHDIQGTFSISDNVMMLWNGKIHAHGTPDELSACDDEVVCQFITGSANGPISID
jgi:phospholipid/cholesterol/gamma-HCH transport system ATP-binding protein